MKETKKERKKKIFFLKSLPSGRGVVDQNLLRVGGARNNLANLVVWVVLLLEVGFDSRGILGRNDHDHADTAVEGAAHLVVRQVGQTCKPCENR